MIFLTGRGINSLITERVNLRVGSGRGYGIRILTCTQKVWLHRNHLTSSVERLSLGTTPGNGTFLSFILIESCLSWSIVLSVVKRVFGKIYGDYNVSKPGFILFNLVL